MSVPNRRVFMTGLARYERLFQRMIDQRERAYVQANRLEDRLKQTQRRLSNSLSKRARRG